MDNVIGRTARELGYDNEEFPNGWWYEIFDGADGEGIGYLLFRRKVVISVGEGYPSYAEACRQADIDRHNRKKGAENGYRINHRTF